MRKGSHHTEETKLKMGVANFREDLRNQTSKICSRCFKEKPIAEFPFQNKKQNLHKTWCKECESKRCRIWRENNRDILSEKKKQYRRENKEMLSYAKKEWEKRNPEKVAESKRKYREDNKEKCLLASKKWIQRYPERQRKAQYSWRENNRERYLKIVARSNKKVQSTISGRLNGIISCQIRRYLKNGKGGKHWETIVGFTLKELIQHLEAQFKNGMDWINYGEWEIDHIIPISFFKYSSYDDISFQECWSLKNLQPLWKSENRRKSNKIICREMI